MAKQLISSSETKCVYRDGDLAIKEFCEGFPKAEVLNEALCTARVEDLPGLHVPKVLSVSVMDGKWSITREFIEGKTLQQLMDENPDKVQEYMEQMVDLQIDIHSKACPLLNKLKEKTIRALQEEEQLDANTRYDLLTRLGLGLQNRMSSKVGLLSGGRRDVRSRLGSCFPGQRQRRRGENLSPSESERCQESRNVHGYVL